MRLWDLCINIDTNTGFQFDGAVVIPDGYLFDPASHQRFIKFGEVGGLLCDIILQINQLNKTIAAKTELIQFLQKTLEADRLEKETLRQQIEYLTKKLFGTPSEKRKDIEG